MRFLLPTSLLTYVRTSYDEASPSGTLKLLYITVHFLDTQHLIYTNIQGFPFLTSQFTHLGFMPTSLHFDRAVGKGLKRTKT